MQCTAVLLLEAAYQDRHTEKHNDEITADIRKLMSWLHAMEKNDPVARRAYEVVRKILRNVAPVLAAKATELLNEYPENNQDAGAHAFDGFTPPHKQQSGAGWAQGNHFHSTTPTTGHQYYPSQQTTGLDQNHTSTSAYDDSTYANSSTGHYHMSSTFGNPFLNSWDEGPPVIDMHNIWHTPAFNNDYPEDLSDMDLLGMYMDPPNVENSTQT